MTLFVLRQEGYPQTLAMPSINRLFRAVALLRSRAFECEADMPA